jgi:hypothetical protein
MTYAPEILDNLLAPATKQRILEALKTSGKAGEEDTANAVQLVHKAFGGERTAAVEIVTVGLQYYLLLTKVTDNSKPFEINEKPKKKKQKLTTEEIYNNFVLEFPETKNYLDLILKLKNNSIVKESLKGRNIKDILVLLTEEAFASTGVTREEVVQFVEASREGFNPDPIREIVTAEDINYCFEAELFKIKLLADFTKLELMESIHTYYEAKAKEAEEQLVVLIKNTV